MLENNNINILVGKRCKEHRKNYLKLNQKQVAEKVGYSQETVSCFERGKTDNMEIFAFYIVNGVFVTTELLDELRNIYG